MNTQNIHVISETGIYLFSIPIIITTVINIWSSRKKYLAECNNNNESEGIRLIFEFPSSSDSEETFITSLDIKDIQFRTYLLRWNISKQSHCVLRLINNKDNIKTFKVICTSPNDINDIIHNHVYCNICFNKLSSNTSNTSYSLHPIRGIRYRCIQCDDFDCCHECFKQHSLTSTSICDSVNHTCISINRNIMKPSEFILTTYSDMLINLFLNYNNLPAITQSLYPSSNTEIQYQWLTYMEMYDKIMNFGSGLRHIGVSAQDIIIICVDNCIDYVIFDMACGIYGYIIVAISSTYTEIEILGILNQLLEPSTTSPTTTSSNTTAIVEYNITTIIVNNKTSQTFINILQSINLESLQNIIIMDNQLTDNNNNNNILTDTMQLWKSNTSYHIYSFNTVCELGVTYKYAPQKVNSNGLVAIAFTSGTSKGIPKGIPITYNSRLSFLSKCTHASEYMRVPREVSVIFTDMAYTANREEILYLLYIGGQIAILSKPTYGIDVLLHQIKIIRPTYISAIPLFWSDIYHKYISELNIIQSHTNSSSGSNSSTIDYNKDIDILHEKYSNLFGDRISSIATGSAHTPYAVLQFMKQVLTKGRACEVLEGYGTMEVGGICSNGKILNGVQWKLQSVNECDYSVSSDGISTGTKIRQGELLVKTNRMINAYYGNTEISKDRFSSDGYFITGDIIQYECLCDDPMDSKTHCQCEGQSTVRIQIIGRKGAMLKLLNGEFLNPEIIENELVSCEHILQAYVHAEMNWKFIIAIIVIDSTFMTNHGMENSKNVIENELLQLIERKKLTKKQIPLAFHLTDKRFTVENGLLTISNKQCRLNIKKAYNDILLSLYQEKESSATTLLNCFSFTSLSSSLTIDHKSNYWSLGLTSLNASAIVSQISQEFNVPNEITMKLMYQSQNVIELSKAIDEWKSQKKDNFISSNYQQTILADIDWKPSMGLLSTTNQSTVNCNSEAACTILLTGANGFLGSVILHQLLSQTNKNIRIIALVRPCKDKNAFDTVIDKLSTHCTINNHMQSRLEVLSANLEEKYFGLLEDDYNRLQSIVTVVIHCAAKTSWTASYYALRDNNVIATQNIINFTLSCHNRSQLIYISTLSAALNQYECNDYDCNAYMEQARQYITTLSHDNALSAGYSISKIIAECNVRSAGKCNNLRYSIIRPGTISPHTQNGYSNMTDFIPRLLSSIMELKTYPLLDTEKLSIGSIDLAAVDYVANIIISVMFNESITGRTYHICSGNLTQYETILQSLELYCMTNLGSALTPSTERQWIDLIESYPSNFLYPLLNFLRSGILHHTSASVFDCTNTNNITYSITCPVFDCDIMIPLILTWMNKYIIQEP